MKPIEFKCVLGSKGWNGKITNVISYGSHTELHIESRSGITVIVGKTQSGNFCCIPDWNAGCHLAELDDSFWNFESLTRAMKNKTDAMTIAKALQAYFENAQSMVK
jgi:hypothetical protein